MPNALNILVVEDEVIVSEEIAEYLTGYGYNVVGQVTSAADAFGYFERDLIDIALLDINIQGDLDGIELARHIRLKHNCAIVFLTAYSDDAILDRAKQVRPEAYLIKPFDGRNLYASINLAFENFNSRLSQFGLTQPVIDRVFLKDGQKFRKVFIRDILYIEASGSYSKVVTADSFFIFSFNLKEAIDRIVHPDLVRAHRSFLVNIKNIDAIEGNQLTLGDHKIQMSQSFRGEILNRLNLL